MVLVLPYIVMVYIVLAYIVMVSTCYGLYMYGHILSWACCQPNQPACPGAHSARAGTHAAWFPTKKNLQHKFVAGAHAGLAPAIVFAAQVCCIRFTYGNRSCKAKYGITPDDENVITTAPSRTGHIGPQL